jgi:hypothetical protein
VFLDSEKDIRRAIHYVENNPEKEALARQHWPFISAYVSRAARRLAARRRLCGAERGGTMNRAQTRSAAKRRASRLNDSRALFYE